MPSDQPPALSRRSLVFGMPLALAGCVTAGQPGGSIFAGAAYGAMQDGPFLVPDVDIGQMDPKYLRQTVDYRGPHRPGTVYIDPPARFLYLVQDGGKALRYGVGVGREGFSLHGHATVGRKAEWPGWTPTPNMMRLIPRYRAYAGGMPGGPGNPLGARALYLYRGSRDTMFRIHGTTEPWTIGHAVSSGCIRMVNQDVIDLYRRVPAGTSVYIA